MAEYNISIAVKYTCKYIHITCYFMRIKCYGKLQQEIKTYEKYNGKYTKSTAEKFLKDYKETLSSDEMEEFESESTHLEMLAETLPDIGFDII